MFTSCADTPVVNIPLKMVQLVRSVQSNGFIETDNGIIFTLFWVQQHIDHYAIMVSIRCRTSVIALKEAKAGKLVDIFAFW